MAWNNPFRPRAPVGLTTAGQTSAAEQDLRGAYEQGRRDAGPATAERAPLTDKEVRAAYERGRHDAKSERKRHPIGMTVLFVAAALGLGVAAYAAFEGSFGRGGERLDSDLAVAADKAEPVVRDAAQQAGEQLKDAGQSLTRDDPPTAP
jgi:hypothetical protein